MRAIVYICAVLAAFLAVVVYGSVTGDGLAAGVQDIVEGAKRPGIMIMIADLYAGFLILAGWIFYRDGLSLKAIILIALMLTIGGNFIALGYILFLLVRTRGDVWETLLGKNV